MADTLQKELAELQLQTPNGRKSKVFTNNPQLTPSKKSSNGKENNVPGTFLRPRVVFGTPPAKSCTKFPDPTAFTGAEIRNRKGLNGSTAAASPRTPHVSQINSKRLKQQSQLARPPPSLFLTSVSKQLSGKHEKSANPFIAPPHPAKESAKSQSDDNTNESVKYLRSQVQMLRSQLEKEITAKAFIQQKLDREIKERMRLEMELKLAQK